MSAALSRLWVLGAICRSNVDSERECCVFNDGTGPPAVERPSWHFIGIKESEVFIFSEKTTDLTQKQQHLHGSSVTTLFLLLPRFCFEVSRISYCLTEAATLRVASLVNKSKVWNVPSDFFLFFSFLEMTCFFATGNCGQGFRLHCQLH